MKSTVISFKTMEEFDRLLQWASRKDLVWSSGAHPNNVTGTLRDSVNTYLRKANGCAICIDENSHIGYASVTFFQESPVFDSYDFKTAQEILNTWIDCTIPEEKETT